MNEEIELSKQHGYDPPVWENIEATHKCYNENLNLLLDNLRENDALFIASHNTETVAMAMKKVKEHGGTDKRVRFG